MDYTQFPMLYYCTFCRGHRELSEQGNGNLCAVCGFPLLDAKSDAVHATDMALETAGLKSKTPPVDRITEAFTDSPRFRLSEFVDEELGLLPKDTVLRDFIPQIRDIFYAFNKSGQSGGSAPLVAAILGDAITKLCLQQPISPITGVKSEWVVVAPGVEQNKRCSGVFRENGIAYYIDAVVWEPDGKNSGYTGFANLVNPDGSITAMHSKTKINFPFVPKTFYVDVRLDRTIHDSSQLAEVFQYEGYDRRWQARHGQQGCKG